MHVTDDPRVGTELAGYRIESLLGWGGMSVVYLAEDLRLKRKVALKLLAAGLAEDESFRERFLRESELAASIDHPNIVPIYEAGTTEDLLYIAMRYVEDRDLKERLQQSRLEPSDAIGILAQVASALDAAHARGLVHRDVKPSNVLLDRGARPDGSDHVYLADFGLTRRVSEKSGIGDDGHLLGTIDYVAPEQIAGEGVDGRADVYSLGCVLYECLVGTPPFQRDSELAVVFAHLETEAPMPSAQRPELPVALDAVIARALAKEPELRYPSCRELVQAALAVAVDEASRQLVDVASRAAAGRSDLSEVEAELAGKVTDLQLAREQARALSATPTPTRLAAQGMCPFKGLASFEPVDADYFFGRERLVAELVARLVGAGFLGIVGPSGSGKSSVLRAGLLPALAGGVLPGSERWRRVLIRPGERPLEELRRLLASGATDPLAEALDALNAEERILLAVDQLEELFTACRSEAERAAFADSLARAAADPEGRAVVVVALRADFYGRFAAYAGLAELLGANQVLVGPMQASELRRAVELPASRVGLRVEPELSDALVDDVEGEPGALPLLSTALLELWQKRQDNALTLAAYRESGGVHGAVARLAEGTYGGVPDERKPLVRALMLRLVAEDEGDAPVRRRAPLAELDLERNTDMADVLARLADSRLVTIGEGSVEVSHEALLREWPRLREWIEEDAEGRRLRRHITQAATEWEAAGRDQGELYRGARLAAALDWSTDHALELNELERGFVAESREASEKETKRVRRTNRRLRGLLAGVAVLLAAAVAGGIFAVAQRGEARDAAAEARSRDPARPAPRRSGARRGGPRPLAPARPAGGRNRRLAADKRLPVRQPSGRARGDRDHARPLRRQLSQADCCQSRRQDARGHRRMERRAVPLRRPHVRAHRQADRGIPRRSGGVQSGWRDARHRRGRVRTLDRRAQPTSGGGRFRLRCRHRSGIHERRFTTRRRPQRGCWRGGPAWITILDSSTLQQAGLIYPEGFEGRWVSQERAVPRIALTAGDSLITASSERGELVWWDLDTGRKEKTLEIDHGYGGYRALGRSPDGRTVAVGLSRGFGLVDVRTGTVRRARGARAFPIALVFSPDGDTVVSTNVDGTVAVWDAETATLVDTLHGHSRAVWQGVFSPDGKTLYTAGADGTAIAWAQGGAQGLVRRQFTFTHDRGLHNWPDIHPGRLSTNGVIAVGLEDRGSGSSTSTTSASRVPACSTRATRSTRSRSVRTGRPS